MYQTENTIKYITNVSKKWKWITDYSHQGFLQWDNYAQFLNPLNNLFLPVKFNLILGHIKSMILDMCWVVTLKTNEQKTFYYYKLELNPIVVSNKSFLSN